MKNLLTHTIILSVLLPAALFACAPEEIRALRSAHRVVAGEILSVTRLSEGKKIRFSIEAQVHEVLLGAPMEDETIRIDMDLRNPQEDPSYEKGTSYVLYLRKTAAGIQSGKKIHWSFDNGTMCIQPDTEKLRGMLGPNKEAKDRSHRASQDGVDTEQLSPLEKKLHSIILPLVDFRCANLYDVIDFLHMASIDFDRTSAEQDKGVNICVNARSFAERGMVLVNFYIETPSLLQVMDVVAGIAGERNVIDDWVIVSKKGFGEVKPALTLGAQGTNAVMYKTLQTTIIPELDFRQATIEDVAQFLSQKGKVNISVATAPGKSKAMVPITFSARHASLLSTLRVLSVLCPLEIVMGETSVTIHPTVPPSSGSNISSGQ